MRCSAHMFAPPKKIGSRLRARYVRSAHMFAQKKSDPSNSKKSARASHSLCALRAHVCPPIINRCPLLAPPLFKSWCRHCLDIYLILACVNVGLLLCYAFVQRFFAMLILSFMSAWAISGRTVMPTLVIRERAYNFPIALAFLDVSKGLGKSTRWIFIR